jgi:TolB-like protein
MACTTTATIKPDMTSSVDIQPVAVSNMAPVVSHPSVIYPDYMWQAPPRNYRSNNQLLTNYVSRLAGELARSLSSGTYMAPIGVASFVNLDSTLESTNLVGNQIAEEFITEIRQLGLPVVDYKLTGHIKVTSSGDFVFSRDSGVLKQQVGLSNILTGTLVWNDGGLVINARIINLETGYVLAAAKGYIPYFVADQIFAGPVHERFIGYSAH